MNKYQELFYNSIRDNNIELFRAMVKHPEVDPSDCDNCAIRGASEYGHLEVAKELLKHPRVDPSDDDNFAIICASENGYLEVVKVLEKAIASRSNMVISNVK